MTAPVPPVDLDQLETALATAPPGPWQPWDGQYGDVGADNADGDIVLDYSTWIDNAEDAEQARRIVRLVLALHTAAPDLIAELRDLRAMKDAVRALATDLHTDARSMWASAQQHDSETDEVVGDTYYETSQRIRRTLGTGS